ncbi:hypothetical protein GUITHDRAFT_104433 [Guillardia theta CCMP2712]|uniref:Peptidase M16 N-terminal domain-containing protein n=1 Tax=Guillardia theta (strain CCMP2712) TaxID=905079 RepID=L1JN74_GUITC|nr:hypothetical protein GUITHDRAFT_104433 [Guillardia theta CCMP2712]EKX50036.1 hypothetical protein GUITHDRAFT_104433 [Guillardia theta CCMP2712]|eukprot:XP_005837016.1 hypothetical protein GUITHDRAFT_104433 [Guillardia theta CCMP2712]
MSSEPWETGLDHMEKWKLGALRHDLNIYKHHQSGLRVAVCKLPGPLCQADIVIPTACQDDKGLPHCLEHLIFMGSARYPSRGFLDKLANLCISQGTNAWTDRDHTAYNAVTAGSNGMLQLLPVFLDHVFSPTLTEEQFLTEVFHFDGDGKVKGVVFCEMQGREATEDDLLDNKLHHLLYPGTAYQYECGGLTKDIVTLNNQMVRDYHRKFYQPEKCFILVHGQIEENKLLAAIDQWWANAELPPKREEEERAWSSVPPPMQESSSAVVEFAAADESVGSVAFAWSGPPLSDVTTCTALSVLFRFLHEGAASPLSQKFVESKEPKASSIDFDLELRLRTAITLQFNGVPYKHDEEGEEEAEGEEEEEGGEGSEMEMEDGSLGSPSGGSNSSRTNSTASEGSSTANRTRLLEEGVLWAEALERHLVKLLEECEDEPSDALQNYVLPELLFMEHMSGKEKKDWSSRLDPTRIFEELRKKDNKYWMDLLDQWILKAPRAEVIMKPSHDLVAQRAEEEEKLLEQRRKELGDEGLLEAGRRSEHAVKANVPGEFPPPGFTPPSMPQPSSISSFPLEQQIQTLSLLPDGSPMTLQLVRTATAFLSVTVGKAAVKARLEETVSMGCAVGWSGSGFFASVLPQLVFVSGVALPQEGGYDKLCDWMKRIVYETKIDEERVKTCLKNLRKDITSSLRDGSTICSSVRIYLTNSQLQDELGSPSSELEMSNVRAVSLLTQKPFIDKLARQLTACRDSNFTGGGDEANVSSSSSSSSLSDRSKGNKTEIDRIVEDLKTLRSLIVSEEEESNARFAQIIAPLPAEHCSSLTDDELCQRFLSSMRTGTSFLASTERPLTLSGQDKRRKRSSLDDPGMKQENKGRRRRRESVCLTRGPLRNNVVEHAVAVSLKGIDSSYLELVIPCSLHKLDDDLFPVMLFAELLSRSEGPLWNRIRGKGLAYHSLLEALEEFLTILKEVEEEVEEAERQEEGGGSAGEGAGEAAGKHMRKVLEESKASLLFSAYFWGVTEPMDEMERETQAIESVSLADLRRVFNRYFKSFLEPGNRCTVLVCPAGKGEGYATELEGLLGHPVKSCKVADFFAEV